MSITGEGQAFYLIGILLELLSSFCAFIIASYTLRGYMLARKKTPLFFSLSFSMLGLALLCRAGYDFLARTNLFGTLRYLPDQTLISSAGLLIALSIFLTGAGYTMLIVLLMRLASKRILFLILVLLALITLNTHTLYITGHILPVILLVFVLLHVIDNFFKKRTTNSFLVLSSFTLLFVSEVFFLLIPQSLLFYFVGNFCRLLAYLQLLANMLLVLKNDVKTRKTRDSI